MMEPPTWFLLQIGCLLALLCLRVASILLRKTSLDAAPNAHWSVKYSRTWLWWHRLRDADTLAVHKAHLCLGPVLRLAPKELSVCDAEGGLKPIYGGRLPKTDFYQAAVSYGAQPSFALKDENTHRQRRKMVTKPYLRSYMKASEEWQVARAHLVQDFRACLAKLSEIDEEADFFDTLFAWTLASVSAYIFGTQGTVNLMHDMSEAHSVQDEYTQERLSAFWLNSWPAPIRRVLTWMGHSDEIKFIERMRHNADKSPSLTKTAERSRPTPYEYIKKEMLAGNRSESLDYHDSSTAEAKAFFSEIQDHLVAGVDTSQITLTICVWLLSLDDNLEWQQRLREEILQSSEDGSVVDVESLPILDAIVMETLRLYPVVAGCLPRMTDKVASVGPEGNKIMLPPGITVHSQAWTLHRNKVFEEPEQWRPERWIGLSPERRKEMDAFLWAFGSGSRRCLGESLAYNSMKTALATIYSDFQTVATERTKLKLHCGNILQPIAEDGHVLRLRVQQVKTTGGQV